jgi:excisionase family DNA binding protein
MNPIPDHSTEAPVVLSATEGARLMRVSRSTMYRAIANGSVFAIRINGRILIPRDRLLATLNGEVPA